MEKIGTYYPVLKEWFYKEVLNNEGFLHAIGTMSEGVLTGDKIGFMPTAGYEEGVLAKCNPEYADGSISSNAEWKIANLGIFKKWCAENIEAELKRGKAINNLSGDPLMAKVFTRLLSESLANSALCLALFGDTTSTNSKIAYVDGVIKQVIAIATADASRRTKLATNTREAFKKAGVATDSLLSMIESADPILRGASDTEIIMTQATYDALQRDMMLNKGVYVPEQMTELYGGMKQTKWQGYNVVVIPAMDKIIASVEGNPLSAVGPHFALFTTKSNLMFGSSCNKQAGVGDVKIWEDEKEDQTYAKVKYSLGVFVALPELVQVMY